MHVLLHFLVEAVLLSAIGGLAGIVVGVAISEIVSVVAGWPTLLSPVAIAGGFLFSAVVGVFFGYYPARRASLLNPIEALRYDLLLNASLSSWLCCRVARSDPISNVPRRPRASARRRSLCPGRGP